MNAVPVRFQCLELSSVQDLLKKQAEVVFNSYSTTQKVISTFHAITYGLSIISIPFACIGGLYAFSAKPLLVAFGCCVVSKIFEKVIYRYIKTEDWYFLVHSCSLKSISIKNFIVFLLLDINTKICSQSLDGVSESKRTNCEVFLKHLIAYKTCRLMQTALDILGEAADDTQFSRISKVAKNVNQLFENNEYLIAQNNPYGIKKEYCKIFDFFAKCDGKVVNIAQVKEKLPKPNQSDVMFYDHQERTITLQGLNLHLKDLITPPAS